MEMPSVAPIKPQSIVQDSFLERQRQTQTPVSIYLVSGIRLQGIIAAYDIRVVLLKSDSYQMIYKKAIATIAPAHASNHLKQPNKINSRDFWANR